MVWWNVSPNGVGDGAFLKEIPGGLLVHEAEVAGGVLAVDDGFVPRQETVTCKPTSD